MKYNIHIPQKEAIMISEDLDILDMSIFDFIQYFASTNSCHKLYEENLVYFWIAYDLIIDEMPLLKIKTKDAIYRRIQKLVSVDLLSPHPENQKMGKTYFRFGEAFSRLYSDRASDEKSEGVRMKSRRGTDEKSEGGTDEKSDKEKHHIEDNHKKTNILSYWNEKGIIKQKESQVIKDAIRISLGKFSEDDIKKAIDNYSTILKSKKTYWEHKWTLSEFLSRKNGLEVFLYKSENDYLIKGENPVPNRADEIKKSQDAEARAKKQAEEEERNRQNAKREQGQILRWYESAPEGLRSEMDKEIQDDYLIKNISHPVYPDPEKGIKGDSESEIERKKSSLAHMTRIVTLKVASKYMQK